MVFALPTARIAVMGPAGKDYVYKDEVSSIHKEYQENVKKGMSEKEAVAVRDKKLPNAFHTVRKGTDEPERGPFLGFRFQDCTSRNDQKYPLPKSGLFNSTLQTGSVVRTSKGV